MGHHTAHAAGSLLAARAAFLLVGGLAVCAASAPYPDQDGPPSTEIAVAATKDSEVPKNSAHVTILGAGPVSFIENRGQFDPHVRFQIKTAGTTLWLTDTGIVFDTVKMPESRGPDQAGRPSTHIFHLGGRSGQPQPPEKPERLVFSESFIAANEHPVIETRDARPGTYNYLTGKDPANWHTDIHGYSELLYRDVWPGIDVRISANGQDLEQEFVVNPGADPRKINVDYDGIEKLEIDPDGSLAVRTAFGILRESKPRIYQQLSDKRVPVNGRFALSGSSAYTFALDSYRPEYALVIDPTVLLYSTYLGGSGDDQGWAIATDSAGNAYVAGYTSSPNFPITVGAYSTTLPCSCGFVTKLGSTGIPVWSTFWDQFPRGIAVDAAGEAIVIGGSNVWVAKLNAAGNALLFEVNLGGGSPQAIALDSAGNAYVAGYSSGQLTTTPNAYQLSDAGGYYNEDAFVTVVNPQGSLLYSTYLGGSDDDAAFGIAVDAYGAVYVGGTTQGSHFPVTPGAFQTTAKPYNNDAAPNIFVAKLNPNIAGPSGLIYASYLAGNGSDYLYGLAVDSAGSAYVAGVTAFDYTFPITAGALYASANVAGGFVTKFNPGGSGLIYSTYVTPGSGLESLQAIALDSLGEAYVVGYAGGGTVPATSNAFEASAKSGANAFIVKLNAAGSGVVYASYIGGSISDVAHAVAVDPTGDAYLTGATSSPDFPLTQGAFQLTYGGGVNDAFVSKFPLGSPGALSITGILPTSAGNAGTVTPEIIGSGFHAGATAQLNCGGIAIPGTNPTVGPGGRLLNMTFNLATAAPGTCDVKVTNPDGTSVTLSQAFTVQPGGAPNILVSLTGAAALKGPAETLLGPTDAVYFITVQNAGNLDSAGGLISLPLVNPPLSLTSSSPPATAGIPNPSWSVSQLAPAQAQLFSATATAPADVGFPAFNGIACFVPQSGLVPFVECLATNETCPSAVNSCNNARLDFLLGCPSSSDPNRCPTNFDVNTCVSSSEQCNFNVVVACLPPFGYCKLSPIPVVAPADPNSLAGPEGVGVQRWMAGAQALTYGILFGNDPSATAPAQQVTVTQPLGANMNLSSASLPGLTIPNGTGNVQVPVPAGSFNPAAGVDEFTTTVDLRPTQNLLVNVDAKLNTNTNSLTWTLGSIDPATGSPPLNPLIGFLPPGAGGNVAFTVTPQPGLATGTQISDQAAVVFNANAPVSTPVWTNTIDNTPPVSFVSALAATQTTSCFRPQWTATDVGSGVQGTTIFVSDTGGPYAPWLTNTTSASAIYNGIAGHTYAFYSQATDLVGNIEATKSKPDASTSVTANASCNGAPSITGSVVTNSLSGTTETLMLQLTNNGDGSAQNIRITSVSVRTLVGTGSVTLSNPVTPISLGGLAAGASGTVTLTLNTAATVKEYSITEQGTVQDAAGNTYSFSISQAVLP